MYNSTLVTKGYVSIIDGIQYVGIIYLTLFIVWIIIGLILNYGIKGFTPELLIEIPPYRALPWRLT